MAAVNLPNASVTGPVNSPIPNPIAPINDPVLVPAENVGDITAPLIVGAELIPASATPVIVGAESASAVATPVIIAANALDPTTPPFALNHARILYKNDLFDSSTVISSGTNGSYVLIPNTFQGWVFTATGTDAIEFTLPSNTDIDTICIGAHTLSGATITTFYDVDATAGGYIQFTTAKVIASNSAIMFHVGTSVSARRIQINIAGLSGAQKIGYITAGVALQMARPFFSGHNPMDQNKKHRYYDAWTETGNMVGRALRSVQLEGDFSWDNLPDAWYRSYMPAFIESATRLPYIIAWNLLEYPDDVAMAFTDGDISSPYSGTRNLRSVSFTARGIA